MRLLRRRRLAEVDPRRLRRHLPDGRLAQFRRHILWPARGVRQFHDAEQPVPEPAITLLHKGGQRFESASSPHPAARIAEEKTDEEAESQQGEDRAEQARVTPRPARTELNPPGNN